MSVERTLHAEALATLLTGVRLLTCVNAMVGFKATFLAKTLPAHIAPKGLLSFVNSEHVHF